MNVVVIGLGSIAKKHIHAIRILHPDSRIFALRSGLKIDKIELVENIFHLDELERKPDFAIICNPTNLHAKYIQELALRGVPMMIEKPAVHSLNVAESLLPIIQDGNIFTYVACNLRFHPCIKFLRSYLARKHGKVNEVMVYCGSYLPDWRPNVDFKDVYSANLKMGGGVHLDLIHELDYTTWLFGQPLQYRGFQSSVSSLQIDAPDYAHYLLNYPHFNVSVSLNYFRREAKRTVEIVFEDITLEADLIRNKVYNGRGDLIFEAKNFTLLDTYRFQLEYFVESLSKKEQIMNNFEESLNVLRIALNHESVD